MSRAAALVPSDPGAQRKLVLLLRGGKTGRALARQDVRLYRALRTVPVPAPADVAIRRYSRLGEHAAGWLALCALGALVDGERRSAWLRALRAVAIAYLANVVLKNVFRRKRPLLDGLPQLVKTPTALSFPSSHATSSFAAARALSPLLPAGPLYAAALTMALSRVRLGVHYPTDIAAGAVLGTVVGSVAR